MKVRTKRRWLISILEFFYLIFTRTLLYLIGFRSLRVGNCRFFGPQTFLKVAEESMSLLQLEDPGLFDRLLKDNSWFYYHPSKLVDSGFSTRTFSVTESYTYFQTHGLAARLIWAHYKHNLFHAVPFLSHDRGEMVALHGEVKRLTRDWLIQHQFPEQLIRAFS